MGRKKLIFNYSKKDIEKELSHLQKETIDLYKGYIKDKTNDDLNKIKETINDDSELNALWYRLIALELYRELGGK